MKHALILLLLLTLCACSDPREQPRDGIDLTGAWVLHHVEFPSGTEQDYALNGDGTSCLIYDQRNLLYECNIATTSTGLVVQPTATTTVTLVDKGGGEWLYLENGDPHPLRASDSTITIQRMGILYTFSRADSLYSEWGGRHPRHLRQPARRPRASRRMRLPRLISFAVLVMLMV